MTPLSEEQIAILRGLAQGHTQDHITTAMNASIYTTKSRLVSISRKFGSQGATQAVTMGYLHGYLTAPMEGEPEPRLRPEYIDILVLLAKGKDHQQAANELGLSKYQLKYRLRNIYKILGAKTECHLISTAFQTRNLILKPKQ